MSRTLYLLALAVFAMGTSEFMLAGLVPDIAADLGIPVGAAGLLTSLFAAGMVIGAPVMAACARRFPVRTSLTTFLLVFAAAHVAGAATTSFPLLLGTRVLAALANAGFLAVGLRAATASVAADRRGHALAVLLAGTTLAMVLGVPAGALLGILLGWRATFWAVALLCAPALIGIVAGIRSGPQPEPERVSLRTELAQLRSPALAAVMVLAAAVNGATFAAFTFLAPVVTDTAGLERSWITVALMLFGIGSYLGVRLAGQLSDDRPGTVMFTGGPLLVLGWVLLGTWAGHPWVLLVLVFGQGVLSFAVGTTLITRVLYAASGAPTMAGSYATAALNLGAVCGPAVAGLTLTSPAGPLGPVWTAAVLSTAGVVCALLAPHLVAGPRGGSPTAR
ncbi:MFS transporter [Mycolicibacterium neoaurum]|uniref:Cmx/CmrA family chloramphenicol efflux MFS transporter n=1 Tax=Mycolicibacterium neoaurum TaxID=1795 RepID=UPI00248C5F9A|nr:Cmx/CmrA family chloramphenicol efflux MFS transporter [Mycolicibacterium neoaurum]WBP92289.1 MFS transporter [Mycolicibacterium neoaurum]WBS06188.1 MFS transporter [Mycolicibacterium neoaurum]